MIQHGGCVKGLLRRNPKLDGRFLYRNRQITFAFVKRREERRTEGLAAPIRRSQKTQRVWEVLALCEIGGAILRKPMGMRARISQCQFKARINGEGWRQGGIRP